MYTDTRSVSQNALAAGRAYENIVMAIDDARDAAFTAFDDADKAAIGVITFFMSHNIFLSDMQDRGNDTFHVTQYFFCPIGKIRSFSWVHSYWDEIMIRYFLDVLKNSPTGI